MTSSADDKTTGRPSRSTKPVTQVSSSVSMSAGGACGSIMIRSGSVRSMAANEDRSIELPAERASVRLARDFVADAVAEYVDDPAEVLLMTSELVSNVVGHVGSAVTITVREGPRVRIEVHNHQAATEAFRDVLDHGVPPAPTSLTGRGLHVVRALATRVGLDDDSEGGKVVWFEWDHPTKPGDGDAALEVDGEPVAAL